MKTKLTPQQSLRLNEFGIDAKGLDLQGLLAMLPKKITDRRNIFHLEMGIDHYSDEWYLKYVDYENCCDDLESWHSAAELIDVVFEGILWINSESSVHPI